MRRKRENEKSGDGDGKVASGSSRVLAQPTIVRQNRASLNPRRGSAAALPPPMPLLVDSNAPPPLWLIAILAAVTATGPLSMQMFLPALPEVQRLFAVD